MNGSIYLIRNSVNSKVYIGQTIQSVSDRFKQHLKLSTRNKGQAIYKAIKNIGKEHFSVEVLHENIPTCDDLNRLEEMYILQYKAMERSSGYNLCPGGQQWRKAPLFRNEDDVTIVELYKSGKTLREIASIYNVAKTTIAGALKRQSCAIRDSNCNLPDRTSKVTKEIMESLYLEKKMRIRDIAKLLNVDEKTINRAKNRYSLKRI